jgi:hypothetical protein
VGERTLNASRTYTIPFTDLVGSTERHQAARLCGVPVGGQVSAVDVVRVLVGTRGGHAPDVRGARAVLEKLA